MSQRVYINRSSKPYGAKAKGNRVLKARTLCFAQVTDDKQPTTYDNKKIVSR